MHCREVALSLQIQRHGEQERTPRHARAYRRESGRGKWDAAEETEIDEGVPPPGLIAKEHRERRQRDRQHHDQPGRRPSQRWPFDQGEHDAEQEEHRKCLAYGVDVAHGGRLGLRHKDRRQHEGEYAHGQIDPEHGAPAHPLDQQPPDYRAQRHRYAHHGTPEPQRPGTLHAAGENLRNDGQRNRIQHRSTHRLEQTGGDEQPDGGRHTAEQRADREDRQPDVKDLPASQPVPRGTRKHQQRGQAQGVDINYPLQLRRSRAEIRPDGRQGDIHNGGVHRHDEQAQAARPQDDDLAALTQGTDGRFHATIVKPQLLAMQTDLRHSVRSAATPTGTDQGY
ncbi:Uncharacterised protein [Mycobacteroides abscessus subsp. massiliense]|nr:Uncharacterised protein [Mycobacteroides abscessus subsp. massiliense]